MGQSVVCLVLALSPASEPGAGAAAAWAWELESARPPAPPRRPTEWEKVYSRAAAGERVVLTVTPRGVEGLAPGLLSPGVWEITVVNGVPQGVRKEAGGPPRPFPGTSAAGSPTPAPGAGRSSASSPATSLTANTFTPTAGILGATNCPPAG